MHNKRFTKFFSILMILFGIAMINVINVYAQAPTSEEDAVSVTQRFTLQPEVDAASVVAAHSTACQLTAELRWYRNQRVRVLYHWQSCSETHTVNWALASVRTASGTFALSGTTGSQEVYDERWDELQADQQIALHTQIDGIVQPTVTTRYQDTNPVWPQIHTRHDNSGACFQFTGHNDPWGVFTAGDQRYTFLLAEKDWETPWLAAPATATVDWHVAFYQDEGLTRLRAEYDFQNVPNPCHTPPRCDGVTRSIDAGTPLPTAGADVTVAVIGENGSQYRIVDEAGEVVAGPAAESTLSLHALPNVTYQAQVYGEGYEWTDEGCTFSYKEQLALCKGVDLNPTNESIINELGQSITATVHGENSTEYQIVDGSGQVVAGPAASNLFTFKVMPNVNYQGQVRRENSSWSAENCRFHYVAILVGSCSAVTGLTPATTVPLPNGGQSISGHVIGDRLTQYQLVRMDTGDVTVGPTTNLQFQFHALPDVVYQVQTPDPKQATGWIGHSACEFSYRTPPPACIRLNPSVENNSLIPEEGTIVEVEVAGRDATQYRLMAEGKQEIAPVQSESRFSLHVMPNITYYAEVANERNQWTTSTSCELSYRSTPGLLACEGVTLSVANGSPIPATGTAIDVKILGKNSTRYRIMAGTNQEMAAASSSTLSFHAMPKVPYVAYVANERGEWITSEACQFVFDAGSAPVAACSLGPRHYGDPGGLSDIRAWIVGDETRVVPITSARVNWNNKGTVTYPTAKQQGPWFTSIPFVLDSRPEVWDIGFGRYRFEAWVYVEGIAEPAYCQGANEAPDHDNIIPDPGPFAKDNPEGKFNRGSEPSRLPTVGRLPFDGGNGPDKIELILWAFEKQGRGVNARITAIANEGKPLARLGMASVTDMVKFDGLNAREGIVYGFQIGEHGPWSPLFCAPPDSNPTTITVYWGAGGMTWLADGAAYGDCWWLTVAAARQGWVTVDETVAIYNALQPVINWHGHQNLVFSLAQNRETGLGPRMQDAVIGLQAQAWHGPLIPVTTPADFQQVVENYQQAP